MKIRKKRSIVWKMTDVDFSELIKHSTSIADVCRHFDLKIKGGNYSTIKRRIRENNIDTSHFNPKKYMIGKTNISYVTKENFLKRLVKNVTIDHNFVKKKFKEFDILNVEKCSDCGIINEWNNKPLILQLDHKNGDSKDFRLENLQMLCPNCHSQTKTFSMGMRKKMTKIPVTRVGRRKVIRPIKEILEKEVVEFPMILLAKKYGVSDNAIRKWCKSYNIHCEFGRGFWTKKLQGN